MHLFHRARAHVSEIHDFIQLGAATLTCVALLIFVAVSGREPDDPVIRMLADVGAVLALSEMAFTGYTGATGTEQNYPTPR